MQEYFNFAPHGIYSNHCSFESNVREISLLYRAILNIILNIQLIAQCFIIKIH